MTNIKICGLQTIDHTLRSAKAGADFVGLVFVSSRHRTIEVSQATTLVQSLRQELRKPPVIVGLFANQPTEEVNSIVNKCDLDMVQLCGRETLSYCEQIAVKSIKVLHVNIHHSVEESIAKLSYDIDTYSNEGHLITLDRLVDGIEGGTGTSFNWEIAKALSKDGKKFILAGGLTSNNVSHAISTTNPWGVDVSSGVETSSKKDSEKIDQFIAEVRKTDDKLIYRDTYD